VTIGPANLNLTLKDIVFDAPRTSTPNTMTAVAAGSRRFELEYYSWVEASSVEGYKPAEKGEVSSPRWLGTQISHRRQDPVAKLLLENEMASPARARNKLEFLDQVAETWCAA
jgi:hypothetical protein